MGPCETLIGYKVAKFRHLWYTYIYTNICVWMRICMVTCEHTRIFMRVLMMGYKVYTYTNIRIYLLICTVIRVYARIYMRVLMMGYKVSMFKRLWYVTRYTNICLYMLICTLIRVYARTYMRVMMSMVCAVNCNRNRRA